MTTIKHVIVLLFTSTFFICLIPEGTFYPLLTSSDTHKTIFSLTKLAYFFFCIFYVIYDSDKSNSN